MSFLLDTNILINHLRGKKAIDEKMLSSKLYISIITVAELYFGVAKSTHPKRNQEIVKRLLSQYQITTINLDEVIVSIYASLKAKLEKNGERLDEFDLLIAASAISTDMTLVTENKKHFLRIEELKII